MRRTPLTGRSMSTGEPFTCRSRFGHANVTTCSGWRAEPECEMDARATELHFHALHGLDDGPATIEESVELLRLAALDGTDTVVATPHVRGDFVTDVSDLPDRVRELSAAAAAEGIARRSAHRRRARGTTWSAASRQLELDLIAQGPPAGRWLLVEAPWQPMGEDFHAATAELRDRGFGVMIAHPERSADAALDDSAGLRRELAAGSLAQVNAQSITGDARQRRPRGGREPARLGTGQRRGLRRPRPDPAAAAGRGAQAPGGRPAHDRAAAHAPGPGHPPPARWSHSGGPGLRQPGFR